ncbi:synphilin-1 [Alosa sapidissima]|uniref:synphilin-1 n=1 Tax=Alosa sapidissima TaxID=34773 RepID=UPI001C0A0AB6|nr:synphilin-1 [Alosa sapidissima]
MDVPEYLDLDEIDFSDDLAYSAKSIPELCRRSEGQSEERQAPAINWSRGVPHNGAGVKPTGIADVYSKFRPVKRVSPLKHQPEVPDSEADGKGLTQNGERSKDEGNVSKVGQVAGGAPSASEPQGVKPRMGVNAGALLGELEHYDLDMDEILDVPYIKSSQQMATLPRVGSDRRGLGGAGGAGGSGTSERSHGLSRTSTLPHSDSAAAGPQLCVLSPVKWPDMRKSKSLEPDFLRSPTGAFQPVCPSAATALHCSSTPDGGTLAVSRPFPDMQALKAGSDASGSQSMLFPLQGGTTGRQEAGKAWGGSRGFGECDDEAKKSQNIINIVREGQISLLPHLAADNLELIRDEEGSNLLHVSASHGHADCLQHLTSLMGEDCLTERNLEQLTPAGLAVRNGHLECVRWMVSETEAIAELSCTRDHPSLIHYAARYGQERILLWLLQFMQEQGISLDELDQQGNSAVHVAAQHGHLGCIQTLVEYGSNVTVQNQQGERPSQSAERQGHTTCSRYLVVVETCMSLASQVVKLTKQLHEQTTARVALQNQLQLLLQPAEADGPHGSQPLSPSHLIPLADSWPEMTLTAEVSGGDGQWVLRQRGAESETMLRKLLSAEQPGGAGEGGAQRRLGVAERRELKLARLKQLMQRSLSESDSDAYPPEDAKHAPGTAPRPERPNQLPVVTGDELPPPPAAPAGLYTLTKKHHHPQLAQGSTTERKLSFALRTSRSVDGPDPSPTSDPSEADAEANTDAAGQKITTSPKSALKSPSSRRKTAQNLKLRVTFDEPVVHKEAPEGERGQAGGDKAAAASSSSSSSGRSSESGETWKRPFGTFRSIMETLSGNQNSNNNNGQSSAGSPQGPTGRKTDSKAGASGLPKGRSKPSAV